MNSFWHTRRRFEYGSATTEGLRQKDLWQPAQAQKAPAFIVAPWASACAWLQGAVVLYRLVCTGASMWRGAASSFSSLGAEEPQWDRKPVLVIGTTSDCGPPKQVLFCMATQDGTAAGRTVAARGVLGSLPWLFENLIASPGQDRQQGNSLLAIFLDVVPFPAEWPALVFFGHWILPRSHAGGGSLLALSSDDLSIPGCSEGCTAQPHQPTTIWPSPPA